MMARECSKKDATEKMGGCGIEPVYFLVVALGLAGCATTKQPSARDVADANDTGAILAARNQAEKQILAHASSLPVDREQSIAGLSVVAEAAYDAASGRTCRALSIKASKTIEARNRVACTDGKAWFFVPDVFGAEGTQE